MNQIFYKLIKKFVLVYLDDILVFSKSKEHVQHLKQAFQVPRDNWFYAKMAKCHFEKDEMHYQIMFSTKRALKWILGKLKGLQCGILLKLDNHSLFWGFAITFAYSCMDIPF